MRSSRTRIAVSVFLVALAIALLHYLVVVALCIRWFDINAPVSRFEPVLYVLLSPAYLLKENLTSGLVMLNSVLWGGVAAALGDCFAKSARRFSLRELLIATTLVAVVLSLGMWLAR